MFLANGSSNTGLVELRGFEPLAFPAETRSELWLLSFERVTRPALCAGDIRLRVTRRNGADAEGPLRTPVCPNQDPTVSKGGLAWQHVPLFNDSSEVYLVWKDR